MVIQLVPHLVQLVSRLVQLVPRLVQLVLLLVVVLVPRVPALQCYQCSTQSEPDCADPFIISPPPCTHSDPRSDDHQDDREDDHEDERSVERFLEDCPQDGRDYFCVKSRQEEMGAVLVTRGCAWEQEDRRDNCTTERWAGTDYISAVCSCATEACNLAHPHLPNLRQTALLAAIFLLLPTSGYLF